MGFKKLFPKAKPIIGCIHLLALPGSPGFNGSMQEVVDQAVTEAEIYQRSGVHGIIMENFRDMPFYPDQLPAETIAAMSVIAAEVQKAISIPLGINALRNDAHSAMAIATAVDAGFIRVNVHTGATLTDQGIIQGKAHETLRLKKALNSNILIFADVNVKHAAPLANRKIEDEVRDTVERGLADTVIVSGAGTGLPANGEELALVKSVSKVPVLIGSGSTLENIKQLLSMADGLIVGSYFKKGGKAVNFVEEDRVNRFMETYHKLF